MGLTDEEVRRLGPGRNRATVPAKLHAPNPFAGMNKAEMEWAALLTSSLSVAARGVAIGCGPARIAKWLYESLTFRLAKGTSYKPDFYVLFSDGHVEIHEVKQVHRGRSSSRSGWTKDAIVKFKVAADLFPEFRWVACEKQIDGSWSQTESADLFKRTKP